MNRLSLGIKSEDTEKIGPDDQSRQKIHDIIKSCPSCSLGGFSGEGCNHCGFDIEDKRSAIALNTNKPNININWTSNNKGYVVIGYRNHENIVISEYSVGFDFQIIRNYASDDDDTLNNFNIQYPKLISGARLIDEYLYEEMKKINIESEIRIRYYQD